MTLPQRLFTSLQHSAPLFKLEHGDHWLQLQRRKVPAAGRSAAKFLVLVVDREEDSPKETAIKLAPHMPARPIGTSTAAERASYSLVSVIKRQVNKSNRCQHKELLVVVSYLFDERHGPNQSTVSRVINFKVLFDQGFLRRDLGIRGIHMSSSRAFFASFLARLLASFSQGREPIKATSTVPRLPYESLSSRGSWSELPL